MEEPLSSGWHFDDLMGRGCRTNSHSNRDHPSGMEVLEYIRSNESKLKSVVNRPMQNRVWERIQAINFAITPQWCDYFYSPIHAHFLIDRNHSVSFARSSLKDRRELGIRNWSKTWENEFHSHESELADTCDSVTLRSVEPFWVWPGYIN